MHVFASKSMTSAVVEGGESIQCSVVKHGVAEIDRFRMARCVLGGLGGNGTMGWGLSGP